MLGRTLTPSFSPAFRGKEEVQKLQEELESLSEQLRDEEDDFEQCMDTIRATKVRLRRRLEQRKALPLMRGVLEEWSLQAWYSRQEAAQSQHAQELEAILDSSLHYCSESGAAAWELQDVKLSMLHWKVLVIAARAEREVQAAERQLAFQGDRLDQLKRWTQRFSGNCQQQAELVKALTVRVGAATSRAHAAQAAAVPPLQSMDRMAPRWQEASKTLQAHADELRELLAGARAYWERSRPYLVVTEQEGRGPGKDISLDWEKLASDLVRTASTSGGASATHALHDLHGALGRLRHAGIPAAAETAIPAAVKARLLSAGVLLLASEKGLLEAKHPASRPERQ